MSIKNKIPIPAICLNFVLLNPYVDKIIMGIDSLLHLKQNLTAIDFIKEVKGIYRSLGELAIEDEGLTLPYKWIKK